jgi:hypothetical protein
MSRVKKATRYSGTYGCTITNFFRIHPIISCQCSCWELRESTPEGSHHTMRFCDEDLPVPDSSVHPVRIANSAEPPSAAIGQPG